MGGVNMSIWRTSVNELFLYFQGAIKAIVPWLDKSRIPYLENEAYDEWDTIVSSLYEAIVVCNIKSCNENKRYNQDFVKYDFHYESYVGMNFIIVNKCEDLNELSVFVSFSAEDNFDKINICRIDKNNLQIIDRGKISFKDLDFYFYDEIPQKNLTIKIQAY